jgi:hypothetical protein
MKTLILVTASACLALVASFMPAASGNLAFPSPRQMPAVLILANAECSATCLAEKTRCTSHCSGSGAALQNSQCQQGCMGKFSCPYGNCMGAQTSCISDCRREQSGQGAQCEQGCGSAYVYCERKCAAN